MAKTKVDLFKADKAMSERVAEFMQKKVWGITLKSRLKREIDDLANKIANAENLRGSLFDRVNEDGVNEIDLLKQQREEESAEKQKALKDQIDAEAKFEFTDADKKFYKAYKDADTQSKVNDAIVEWFKTYNLDVTNSTLLNEMADAISGKKRATAKTIIRSDATKFVDDKRTKNDVLGIFYGLLSEKMLEVGTLKPTAIQEDVREFYAPKKVNKKVSK